MKIAQSIDLPLDAIARTLAILAQKGAGKTYTGMKLTELMLEAGGQVVALDPTGVWWGLKAEGTGPGFPILVMGGSHGDIPLSSTAGALVADFIVTSGQSVVLDLSAFNSNAEQTRFVTDFAERLFRAKHDTRTPLHLMLDEADSFAPQRPMPGEQRMLGALEAIVRRGRSRGLGMTMISQRPAVLNKNVLTQADLLIALRVVGKQDHKALGDWTALHGTREEQAAFLDALPSLPNGTAFFWSPGWLKCFISTKVLPRRTFDSSATPEPGIVIKPPKLAQVDIAKLSAEIKATVQDAKANDPKELKAEIARLKAELAKQPKMTTEVPVLTAAGWKILEETRDLIMKLLSTFGKSTVVPAKASPMAAKPVTPRQTPSATVTADVKLGKCETKILHTLAAGGQMTKRKLGMLTGYSSGGGGFNNALSRLRTHGLIAAGEPIKLLDAGSELCRDVPPLPTGEALHTYWLNQVGKAERSILQSLLDVWPDTLSKEQLGEATGYVANGGGFNNALSRLRTMELIEGRADLKASDDLF